MAGMSTRPGDTAATSWQTRREILARMDPTSRLRTAIDLSDAVRELQIAGMLVRHPAWSRADAVAWLIQRLAGRGASRS